MKEKIEVNVNGNATELIIREGAAVPIREPEIINVTGTIGAPAEWYTKRKSQIDVSKSHVIYSLEKMEIVLVVDEESHFAATITGKTKFNPELEKFGINAGKTYTVNELKNFIKLNRYFFADQDENLKIVTNLEKFRAKVQTQIEQHGTNRGDKKNLLEVSVDTNMDLKFDLNMPIFLGEPKMRFQVEICFDIKDANVIVWLESAELQNLFLSNRDALIQKNIAVFKENFFVVIES